jgi:hypothetical protein
MPSGFSQLIKQIRNGPLRFGPLRRIWYPGSQKRALESFRVQAAV